MRLRSRGRTIGGYVLGRSIGAGGAAEVFAALHRGPRGIDRLVALKLLRADGATTFRESFHREAVIATRLEHPNIVRTYEVGEVDGELFMSMELLVGANLASIRDTECPVAIALRIICDVLAALHAAHDLSLPGGIALGLVHQDVTPQNVLITTDGITKLLDFGVARFSSIDRSTTDTVRGKPSYLAPEQLEGRNIDRRVDVFACGILLYELLSGRRLFVRPSIALTYHAILLEPIPDVREHRRDVAEPVAGVIRRALHRPPGARFPTAEAMRLAILTAQRDAGIPEASNSVVASWLRQLVPVPSSARELELEIIGASIELPDVGPLSETLLDRAEATLSAVQLGGADNRNHTMDSDLPNRRTQTIATPAERPTRRRGTLAFLIMVGATFGALGVLRWRSPRQTSGNEIAAAVASTLPAFPSAEPPPLPSLSAASASASIEVASAAPVKARPPPHNRRAPDTMPATSRPASLPEATPDVAAAAAKASLSVYSNVWGTVFVDGVSVGVSPLRGVSISPGTHRLTIRTTEGEQTQTVNVDPGGDVKARFMF